MKMIFAVLTVLVLSESSFAAINSGVNNADPNILTNSEARMKAVAPNSCRNRAGKDTRRTIESNGERSGSDTKMANGARSGSNA